MNTPYLRPRTTEETQRLPRGLRWWHQVRRLDGWLLLFVFLMTLGGVIMVVSASVPFAVTRTDKEPLYFLKRHLLFLSVGSMAMLALAFWDYRRLLERRWLLPPTLALLGLLAVVVVRNHMGDASGRTLLPQGSVQPGEFVKPLLVVYLAAWLTRRRSQGESPWTIWVRMGAIISIPALLLLFQPDLSAAGTVVLLGFIMLFLSGATWSQVALTATALLFLTTFGIRVVTWVYPTAAQRLALYTLAWRDPTQVTGHVQQAFFAFIRGGWWGRGLGTSQGKVYALPLPHTDSVYAVIGEEFGVVGALVALGLFLAFLWRGLAIAARAQDAFGRLLAGGLTLWLVLEAFIHIGGMTGLLPQAGNALPFFSYGGSNLSAALASVGLMLSVARVHATGSQEEGQHAVVDLRRRHGRRRVPRAGRVPAPAQGD